MSDMQNLASAMYAAHIAIRVYDRITIHLGMEAQRSFDVRETMIRMVESHGSKVDGLFPTPVVDLDEILGEDKKEISVMLAPQSAIDTLERYKSEVPGVEKLLAEFYGIFPDRKPSTQVETR